MMFAALVVAVLAACHVGPQIDQKNIGRQPQGASVVVELTEKAQSKRIEHSGELLEVRDDGLVVLTEKDAQNDSRIILIPWGKVYRARASDLPGIAVRTSQGDSQRRASTDELRNVSRFPQGLSPELTDQLLTRYGQPTVDTVD